MSGTYGPKAEPHVQKFHNVGLNIKSSDPLIDIKELMGEHNEISARKVWTKFMEETKKVFVRTALSKKLTVM